jgi:hypothetical protein
MFDTVPVIQIAAGFAACLAHYEGRNYSGLAMGGRATMES